MEPDPRRRADVTKVLEAQREAGKIGSALQAAVEVRCAGDKFEALLAGRRPQVHLHRLGRRAIRATTTSRSIATPLEHAKCERCWHVRDDVGANAEHPTPVRPLRQQPARVGRGAQLCPTRPVRWYALAGWSSSSTSSASGSSQPYQFGETIYVAPFWNWVLTFNPGAAFSFLADQPGWQRWFFTILALGVSAWMAVEIRRHPWAKAARAGLALVMGGAWAMVDRPCASVPLSISSNGTPPVITGRPSTWPTPPSRSAPSCSSSPN